MFGDSPRDSDWENPSVKPQKQFLESLPLSKCLQFCKYVLYIIIINDSGSAWQVVYSKQVLPEVTSVNHFDHPSLKALAWSKEIG